MHVFATADEDTKTLIRQRLETQDWITRQEYKLRWWGLWTGLIIAIAFLSAATFLIASGHDTAGTVLGTVDLVALTAVFVTGRTTSRRGSAEGLNDEMVT